MTDKTTQFSQKRFFLMFFTSVLFLILSGCAMDPNGGSSGGGSSGFTGNDNGDPGIQKSFIAIPNTYKYGLPYVPSRMNDTQLLTEYNSWKGQYVVSTGCPAGAQRVRRDSTSLDDTVSEGMGYGMLLAFYFNDQPTFDALYKYVLAHMTDRGLMHWIVRADGVNITEFGIPTPHDIPWTNTISGGPITASASVPAGTGWVKLAENGRKLTSATDADEDMALALCMAAKVWGSSANFNYLNEAKTMVSNIMKYDMHPGWGNPANAYSPFVGAGYYTGGTWGGVNPAEKPGWNPCYFTPAWYPVFYAVSGDSSWLQMTNLVWQHMDVIGQANNGTGLFPDWCDTSSFISKQTYGCSDILPSKSQSYNFYYDSVRVAWRMAAAGSWFNDQKAIVIARQNAEFFKVPFYTSNIVDGYAIDGTAWDAAKKDPNNPGVGGVNKMGAVYVSMIGSATLHYGDYDYANKFYQTIANSRISYTDPYGHYYGNTLRLLALLYMGGELVNYYDTNNHLTITVNPVPGTINAEDYANTVIVPHLNFLTNLNGLPTAWITSLFKATNGANLLTNLGGIAAVTANSGFVCYEITNTYNASQYGLYSVVYTVYRYGTYTGYGPQYGGDSISLYIDGLGQQETVRYGIGSLNTWVSYTNKLMMTPGLHTLSIIDGNFNAFGIGSIQVTYLGAPPISPINNINLSNYAVISGAAYGSWGLNSLSFNLYLREGYYSSYMVNVPGVPGGPAKNYTIAFQGYYGGYAHNAVFSFWTNMSSPYASANLNFATAPIPSPAMGTVSLCPGLQILVISGCAETISNILIY